MRPRIRSLKPEMWQDEKVGRLSHGARLLLIGLITLADDEGRFRAPTSLLLGHIFMYDEDAPRKLRGWVDEVKQSGIVVFYIADGLPYGAFRHWKAHQKINRATDSLLPPPPDHNIVRDNALKKHDAITDQSVINPGSFTPSRAGARSDPILSSVVHLSERLAGWIRQNDPKADPQPESDRWLSDMRLLIADRDGDVSEIQRIIDWCQQDSFWRCNVLSPGKLRAKFTQLLLKASERNGHDTSRPTAQQKSEFEEFAARRKAELAAQEQGAV